MKSETREQLDRYWARELGVTSRLGQTPRMCCTVQHWYPGVQLFTNGERLIIASPPTTAAVVQDAIIGASPEEVFSVAWLQRVFANDAETILGPAEVTYADDTTFRSAQPHNGRALSPSDAAAYHALIAALTLQEMEESGFTAESLPTFGAFFGDTLCAVARYEVWPPAIAHPQRCHPSTPPASRVRPGRCLGACHGSVGSWIDVAVASGDVEYELPRTRAQSRFCVLWLDAVCAAPQ